MTKELAHWIMEFIDTDEFKECWGAMMEQEILEEKISLKQICSIFYGFGAMDVATKGFKAHKSNGN